VIATRPSALAHYIITDTSIVAGLLDTAHRRARVCARNAACAACSRHLTGVSRCLGWTSRDAGWGGSAMRRSGHVPPRTSLATRPGTLPGWAETVHNTKEEAPIPLPGVDDNAHRLREQHAHKSIVGVLYVVGAQTEYVARDPRSGPVCLPLAASLHRRPCSAMRAS
jgi:hypothetical protein